jgi:hypothetical protein
LLYRENPLDPWQAIRARIGTPPSDPFGQMPTVLSLKAAIDLVFHGRATKADWNNNRRKYSWLVERIEAKGNDRLAEQLRENGEKMPFMAAHWIRAAETWQALSSDRLTLDALDDWLRSYRPSDG